MTIEERERAIDALKISAPVMAVTQEEFNNYIQTLNNIMDWLEQEPKTGHWVDDKCSICGKGIEDLIDSREWYRNEEPNFCPFCGIKMVNDRK